MARKHRAPAIGDRDVIVVRIPRPSWPWRKSPVRTLSDFIRAVPDGDRAVYWRALLGGRHWALLLVTHGRKGDTPPAPPRRVELSPKWRDQGDAGRL